MDLEKGVLPLVDMQNAGHFLPLYRFVRLYISHLLPALERIESEPTGESNSRREHVVRIEVDMALALSAEGFTWSHALRSKLEKFRDLARKNPVRIIPVESRCGSRLCDLKRKDEIEGNISFVLLSKLKNPNANCILSVPKKYSSGQECCEDPCDTYKLHGKPGKQFCDKVWWKKSKKELPTKTVNIIGKIKYKRWRQKLFVKAQTKKLRSKESMHRKIKAKKSLQCRMKELRSLTPGGSDMDTDVLFNELGNYISCLQMQVKVLHHLVESSGITL